LRASPGSAAPYLVEGLSDFHYEPLAPLDIIYVSDDIRV
jgi:hypothetical protein